MNNGNTFLSNGYIKKLPSCFRNEEKSWDFYIDRSVNTFIADNFINILLQEGIWEVKLLEFEDIWIIRKDIITH